MAIMSHATVKTFIISAPSTSSWSHHLLRISTRKVKKSGRRRVVFFQLRPHGGDWGEVQTPHQPRRNQLRMGNGIWHKRLT